MTRNVPASIHQRLLNRAKAESRPFNELLQYFALERFLYRLGRSAYRQRFVLKGALTFTVHGLWTSHGAFGQRLAWGPFLLGLSRILHSVTKLPSEGPGRRLS